MNVPLRPRRVAPIPAPATPEPDVVIELGALGPAALRAGRLLVETVLVPTALLYVLLHLVNLVAGLTAVLAWCCLTVTVRWLHGRHLPGTLLLCAGVLCARAGVAMAMSSAFVYLIQPVLGSVLMALVFLGSAAIGRPVTIRLARDFVTLPAHLFARRGVRRMFTQVALAWGVSRLVDAGMSIGFLHWGLDFALLSRGVFSGVLTAVTVAGCTYWGWRRLAGMPGVTLCLRARPVTA